VRNHRQDPDLETTVDRTSLLQAIPQAAPRQRAAHVDHAERTSFGHALATDARG